MPNVPPGLPIAPGIAGPTAGYPQYGAGGGNAGSPVGWNVVTAHNALEKQQDIQKGYFVWFTSQSAAQDFISSESSQFGSGSIPNPLNFLGGIADFFHRLTEASTWIRVGEFLVGGMLIYVGIKAAVSSGGVSTAAKTGAGTAKKTGSGIKTVYRKATPTGRATSVIVKHERKVAAAKTQAKAAKIRAAGRP